MKLVDQFTNTVGPTEFRPAGNGYSKVNNLLSSRRCEIKRRLLCKLVLSIFEVLEDLRGGHSSALDSPVVTLQCRRQLKSVRKQMDNLPGELCVNLVSVRFRVPFGRLSLSPVHNLNTIASFMNKQMNKKQIVLISAVCCLVSACRRVDNSAGSVWIPCGYNTVQCAQHCALLSQQCRRRLANNGAGINLRSVNSARLYQIRVRMALLPWACTLPNSFPSTVSMTVSTGDPPGSEVQALRCFLQ